MEPTLAEGDLLLTWWGRRARPGRIAVVRLPPDADGRPRPLSIKRVSRRDPAAPERWWIDSDNPREGVTSFEVGSLTDDDVLATAPARLWPRPRILTTRHTR
ncbi:peptidase S24 [Knoellia subterranea KCTC 19937]|uniref:Peptidase S24 n=2 Tax=Knoellia TaxID=136099 RepID=A0A0A0JRL5_9MICO|nr:peptidase S24 [Knoellia subterranea KCTC 19937]